MFQIMRKLGGESSSSSGSLLKSVGKGVILAEVAAFFGCYMVWRKLNRDQSFRLEAFQRYPPLLEAYYTVGDTFDPDNKIR